MDERQSTKKEESEDREEGENGLDWLLRQHSSDSTPVPMDTNISLSSPCRVGVDASGPAFSRELLFKAASEGDAAQLHGLLQYLLLHGKKLSDPEFTDERNGKTALLKALLNLKHGNNETIEVLLGIAEKTGDLETLINASYQDPFFKGQTALHVAIERRSFDLVRLLVQKGADVQAKANGKFFQRNAGMGFYFGELPLSLAACTNQPDLVSFLMENAHRRADVTDRDSQGNTVLHTLVVIADNSVENTDTVARIYDQILVQHHRLRGTGGQRLEDIKNNQNLSPLKLAATLGKLRLFKHMLEREFADVEMRRLSRKLTEWVYGPVRSSLYDISSIDTSEEKSVLELIVFGSEIPEKSVKERQEDIKKDLDLVHREIQQHVNDLDVVVPLRLHQIEFIVDDSVPSDTSEALLAHGTLLDKLQGGIKELQMEKITEKTLYRKAKQDGFRLRLDLRDMEPETRVLTAECNDLMMAKFGKLVDVDVLLTQSASRRLEELKLEKLNDQAVQDKELEQWDAKVEEANVGLFQMIKENSELCRSLASLMEERNELEHQVVAMQKWSQRKPSHDVRPEIQKDIRTLKEELEAQLQEEKVLREKMELLSSRGRRCEQPSQNATTPSVS